MITRLTLPNDQWIDVKDRLRVRDKRDVHSYSVDGVSSDGQTYRFNVVKHQIATAAVRITNWYVLDDGSTHKDGKPQPIVFPSGKSFKDRIEAIENLDEEVFEGITEALGTHAKDVEVAAEDAKKETATGGTGSAPTLPSAS